MKVPGTQESLTTREMQVVRCMYSGATAVEAAEALNMAENTVRTHLKKIYRKTGCSRRQHLVRWAQDNAGALGLS